MRQSKSSCLSVMNPFKVRLSLLRDVVLNRAIFRGFCFEICAEVSRYTMEIESIHVVVVLMMCCIVVMT